VQGFFSQEDASKALKIPGQQPDFGAKRPWPEILQQLQPGRKLIYLIRHGEAVSNAVQAAVGELAWMSVATACYWTNETSGEAVRLFDPDLTERGRNQVHVGTTQIRWLLVVAMARKDPGIIPGIEAAGDYPSLTSDALCDRPKV